MRSLSSGLTLNSNLYFRRKILPSIPSHGCPMRFNPEKLIRVKKTVDLVNSCAISIDQAIAVAVAGVGGTVFDVKIKEMNRQIVWRVKLVRSEQRVKVYVNAESGIIV